MHHDFSAEAQRYFEYIGTHLTNRSGDSPDHKAAQNWIVKHLVGAGYSRTQITLQVIEEHPGTNIVLKIDGQDPTRLLIVGAHYDGDGVGDNGSGVALLLSTLCGLVGEPLPFTTYAVFFDEEETGCNGSVAFAASLTPEQAASTVCMINIDAIAFGDYCNVYGGHQDPDTKQITLLQAYTQACAIACKLGFHVWGPEELDGYFAAHGEGPALDPLGLFTSPWTPNNPAPEDTVKEEWRAYSPTTIPMSDHAAFDELGIPYLYFEATNWFSPSDDPKRAYIGYTDVGDPSIGVGGMIMNTEFDNLETMAKHFPGRSLEHFKLYSPLLAALLLDPVG
ncbi:M28 family metallopeptidase [Slackia heliotrinireducens]|uniref:M28 family metallopeptidase n=1 Tax=Slackia heliotrinireducens TaxID=84110 RepID=UPI0033160A1F